MHGVRGPTSCVGRKVISPHLRGRGGGDLAGVGARGMRAGGFPGNPGGLVVSIVQTAGGRAPAHHARGRGRSTWRPTERSRRCSDGTAGRRQRSAGGWTARSRSVSEYGDYLVDTTNGGGTGRGHPVEGKTANTPRVGPVSTSRQRIAELARQALGMAVAIAWLPGPAGTRRRVAKPSVEEPDAAEPARPDLWGARVSNGCFRHELLLSRPYLLLIKSLRQYFYNRRSRQRQNLM